MFIGEYLLYYAMWRSGKPISYAAMTVIKDFNTMRNGAFEKKYCFSKADSLKGLLLKGNPIAEKNPKNMRA